MEDEPSPSPGPTREPTMVSCRRARVGLADLVIILCLAFGCGRPGSLDTDPTMAPLSASAAATAPSLRPPVTTLELPARAWVPRRLEPGAQGPIRYDVGTKHTRVVFDSKRGRMVLAGGDVAHPGIGNGNGNSTVWAIDLENGTTWTLLHAWCARPGELMPGTPDSVGWVYASRHDQGVMLPGFYFLSQQNRWCPDAREILDAVVYDFATNTWKPAPFPAPPGGWGGDIGASFAVYDPATDSIYRFRTGGLVEVFSMAGSTRVVATGPLDNGGNRDQPAIDVQGRSIYRIGRDTKALLRFSIRSRSFAERIPLPAQWAMPPGDMETYAAFDPRNRVLLLPNVESFGGRVLGLGIYHVDRHRWEWEAVTPVEGLLVRGNVFGFDEKNNVFFLAGGHRSEGALPPVTAFWLYRYQ
jgi:hypothetical protein